MKKFFEEFKQFAIKGNMFDMAVGIIIGSAFTAVVNSLTDNLINPLLKFITGRLHIHRRNCLDFSLHLYLRFLILQ